MLSMDDVEILQVGEKWFYTLDNWVATRGPFESYQQAHDALQVELQNYYGR